MSNATVMTLKVQITGTATNPLTEEQVDAEFARLQSLGIFRSVDTAMDLERNRAKLLLVFDRPVSLAELSGLGL